MDIRRAHRDSVNGAAAPHAVVDAATIADRLPSVFPAASGSQPHQIRIEVLRQHRTRRTYEIEWPGANGRRSVIGKAYAADRTDVYRAMEAIHRAGFGADDACSIPQPLAYVRELHLLLLEKVPGPRAKDVLVAGPDHDRIVAASRCARWLARFHATAPHAGQPYRLQDVLDSLDEWSQPFVARGPHFADRAKQLRQALEAAAGRLEPTELCAGHAHYTCGQVLLSVRRAASPEAVAALGSTPRAPLREERTVAFDWDGFDQADPCRDLASFVIDLKRLAWKHPDRRVAFDHAVEVFLNTYLAQRRAQVESNLPFYAAALCLRLARRDLDKRHEAQRAETMLDMGMRILENGLSTWTAHG